MPLGTEITAVGLLLFDRNYLVIRTDGGGEWEVEVDREARQLIGRRVCVHGSRSGFNLIAVRSIEAC